jgi:hypothetical protein
MAERPVVVSLGVIVIRSDGKPAVPAIAESARSPSTGWKASSSNGWIKLADEHDRENGREQRQQSFVPRAHDR